MSKSGQPSRTPWVIVAGGFHQRGGMDKANAALATYLAERGTPVHVVAHDIDPEIASHPAINAHRARKPADSVLVGESYLGRMGRLVASRVSAAFPGTRVVVNGGNCDWPDINWVHCVHRAWNSNDCSAPVWFRAKNRVVKTVARRREARALRRARLVLANSEKTRRDLIELLALNPDYVHTVYLGADSDWGPPTPAERCAARAWLGKPNGRPLVAFVGALGYDRNKGFDTLWSAWGQLCRRPDWDADLIVAGDAPGAAEWRSRTARFGLEPRVTMLGFTDRVKDVLAAADLLVSPVRYEAYGLNVQEAVCRGVPALVSACAGVAERYPCELRDLLLPDPENADDLASRLVGWRSNLAAWKERVMPLARELRRHSWSRMAERIVSIAEDRHELPAEDPRA